MKTRRRIGIDVSGGDFGISEILPGAIKASQQVANEVVVYGNMVDIGRNIPEGGNLGIVSVIRCDRVNEELETAFDDLCKGKLSALITASNSKRLLGVGARYRQEGVPKPAYIAPCPVKGKMAYFLDVGATTRVNDPKVFEGWALVGHRFLTDMGIKEPRIGLLNIATERAYPELAEIHKALISCVGYVGYAEPSAFANGEIDLWMMEGFVGNTVLKLIEKIIPLTLQFCQQELANMPLAQLHVANMASSLTYDAHLVSPVLGLGGKVFRVHGRCDQEQIAKSFKAVEQYL